MEGRPGAAPLVSPGQVVEIFWIKLQSISNGDEGVIGWDVLIVFDAVEMLTVDATSLGEFTHAQTSLLPEGLDGGTK